MDSFYCRNGVILLTNRIWDMPFKANREQKWRVWCEMSSCLLLHINEPQWNVSSVWSPPPWGPVWTLGHTGGSYSVTNSPFSTLNIVLLWFAVMHLPRLLHEAADLSVFVPLCDLENFLNSGLTLLTNWVHSILFTLNHVSILWFWGVRGLCSAFDPDHPHFQQEWSPCDK